MEDDPQIEKIGKGKYRGFLINEALKNGNKVLDIGCGVGWLSLELARHGMFVDAIDISEDNIEIAKSFLKGYPYKDNFGILNYMVSGKRLDL